MFKSRVEAGKLLGERIRKDIGESGNQGIRELKNKIVVLGIPRGGVIVANKTAEVLGCPLDVIVVKKLGAPGNKELAIGAVGETNGSKYIDKRLALDVGADKQYLKSEILNLKSKIKKRERLFRQGKPPLDLKGKIVIAVDDGAATGATMIAACREIWNNNPKKVIVGLPVVSKDTLKKLEQEADEVIFLEAPWPFFSVGQFYESFPQTSDSEVVEILKR